MKGRWWPRRSASIHRSGSTQPPAELRAHLPLVWPSGPSGPVDVDALRGLADDYGRSGRTVEDLLEDLVLLCDVVGIQPASAMLEVSSVAWSEAFLNQEHGAYDDGADLAAVERRLAASVGRAAWGDLAPHGWLVTVTYPPRTAGRDLEVGLPMVARQVGVLFPGSVSAEQRDLARVVAAVADRPDLAIHLGQLQSWCEELATPTGVPVVRHRPVPAERAGIARMLRHAG